MATTRSLTDATLPAPASSRSPSSPASARHRLRAVGRDEDWGLPRSNEAESLGQEIADLLPPGATWLPAPQHAVPRLPGRPPMVGYLVLVPADQRPPHLPVAVPARPDHLDRLDQPDRPEAGAGGGTAPGAGDPLVRVDTARRIAEVDGHGLDLTYLEFELLAHLVAHPHRVHTRDQLVTTVWGYDHVGDGRTVDVHIARLRRKLGAEHRRTIQTVRRVGYKYAPPNGR
ncbi:winged helix-turn-helix domain-containing protein [Streptomyces sp. NPDC056188]|uniref:winged helix-turn-helix domain-containing protein n=1 Tax=Streptomyces sp. NPDC056188 TaxID=3345740 RepID=UPI0035E305C7